MRNYLNTTFLKNKRNKNMPIIQALLKYGQDNFAVLIVFAFFIYIINKKKKNM